MFAHSSFKRHWYLFWSIGLSLVSCSNAKYTQCQQLIEIANQANRQTQAIIDQSSGATNSQIWSEAANVMNQAAEQISALSLEDSQLMNYQNNLVEIFRLYSQATAKAIAARENKNLPALESAVAEAKKAGLLQEKLVRSINSYCLGEAN